MKAQTCCCHICRTSLNQYKREFIPCTQCNKIVCKNCFGTKWKGESWESANSRRNNWSCPACEGTCTCPRCKKAPKTGLGKLSEDLKPHKVRTERDMKEKFQFLVDELYSGDSNDGLDIMPSPESEGEENHAEEITKSPVSKFKDEQSFLEAIRPKVKSVLYSQYEEVLDREKKCENTIREMEKLLYIMKNERSEILEERSRLENILNFQMKEVDMTSTA
eukprot:TRINITY_DN26641_c0_g1_i1.p1 TRINITY_DN26641_c0_g1~~TRINITY_DN26641_c0_g1_i1.p1  ORF type:complete len:220 (+),score=40.40 TRINITY_DN26641_c0_g1_i1:338-997(+)